MAKTIEQLSKQYADKRVKDSPYNEYKGYSFTKQKELTRFDGYDIEQAYEDGANAVLEEFEKTLERACKPNYVDIALLMDKIKQLKC